MVGERPDQTGRTDDDKAGRRTDNRWLEQQRPDGVRTKRVTEERYKEITRRKERNDKRRMDTR